MEIRSYRNVFALERRVYRVENLRLNPAGIPVRGIVYFIVLLACALIGARLPLLGAMAHALPWYVRDVGLPGTASALACVVRIEGRPFHLAGLALLRYSLGPRQYVGCRPLTAGERQWLPAELLVLVDGSEARLRRLRYTGPGAVLVGAAHIHRGWHPGSLRRLARRPSVSIAPLPGRRAPASGKVVALGPGARLVVSGERPGGRRGA